MHLRILWLIGLHIILYGGITIWLAAPLDWLMLAIGSVLIWISVVDCRSFIIPDSATVLLLLLAGYRTWVTDVMLVDHILGAVIWPLLFWLTAWSYRKRRGMDGLGFGDVKLMAAIGLLCGFTGTVFVVLGAAIAGIVTLGVVTMTLKATGETESETKSQALLAFGSFLSLTGWVNFLAS